MKHNKKPKGIMTLIALIIVLVGVLAGSIVHQNKITSNAIIELEDFNRDIIHFTEVADVDELKWLNEGWYQVTNGYVYYLEYFDNAIPIYIKVKNPSEQNGLLVVNSDGSISFDDGFEGLPYEPSEETLGNQNLITGEVSGLEAISGMQSAQQNPDVLDVGGNRFFRISRTNDYVAVRESGSDFSYVRATYNGRDLVVKENYGNYYSTALRGQSYTSVTPSTLRSTETVKTDGDLFWFKISDSNNYFWVSSNDQGDTGIVKAYRSGEELRGYGYVGSMSSGQSANTGVYTIVSSSSATSVPVQTTSTTSGTATPQSNPKQNQDTQSSGATGTQTAAQTQTVYIYTQNGVSVRSQNPPPVGTSYQILTRNTNGRETLTDFDSTNQQIRTMVRDSSSLEWRPESQTSNWEVLLYPDSDGKRNWVSMPNQYSSQQQALDAARGYGTDVRRQQQAASGSTRYNVFDTNENNIGYVMASNEDQAQSAAQSLANLRGTTFKRVEMPRFSLSTPQTGELIIVAPTKEAAMEEFRRTYGTSPTQAIELLPGQSGSKRQTYEVIVPGGERFTFNANSDEEARIILLNYQGNPRYVGRELQLNKMPTIEDLRARNPGVPDSILRRELENIIAQRSSPQQNQLSPPALQEIKNQNGQVIAWYVNGNRFTDSEEAQRALSEANSQYTRAVSERYARNQLQGRTLTGETTSSGEILARDNNGLYRFVATEENGMVTGGRFEKINQDEPFTILQKFGDNVYPVTYVVDKNGVRTPRFIGIEGTERPITSQEYSLLSKHGSKGYKPYIDPVAGFAVRLDTAMESGAKDTVSYRISHQTRIIYPGGRIFFTEEVTDKDNKILSSTEAEVIGTSRRERQYRIENGQRLDDFSETINDNGKPVAYKRIEGGVTYYIDYETGRITKDQVLLSDAEINQLPEDLRNDLQRRKDDRRAWTSRKAFANFERVLTEYKGLSYFPSLFVGKEDLLKWRSAVDDFFVDNYLGIESWTSHLCEKVVDIESTGVAFAETPQGLAQIGAHIQMTRTEAITNESGTYYIYKITFNVRNGDYENDPRAPQQLWFNVELIRAASSNAVPRGTIEGIGAVPRLLLFRNDINVSRGGTYGRVGANAIVRESQTLYSEICMKFPREVPSRWNIENNELCTPVTVSDTRPTALEVRSSQSQRPSQDMNDF